MNEPRKSKRQAELNEKAGVTVNFANVDTATLKKLKRYYASRAKPGLPPTRAMDEDTMVVVTRNFAFSEVPREDETIDKFINLIKTQD